MHIESNDSGPVDYLTPTMTNLTVLMLALALMLTTSVAATNDKVKVELYYESQCPGCRDTITRSFREAYSAPGFLKMADITLVPFGNAVETNDKDSPFQCQHGETECQYNLIETCALDKIKCPHQQFQFINCIENYNESREPNQDYDSVLESCASLTGVLVADDIGACYKGPEGNTLEHGMAAKTAALSPAHEYVPWIVVDGVHNEDVQNQVMASLLEYVCKTYTGPDKSPGCPDNNNSAALRSNSDNKVTGSLVKGEICHRNDATFLGNDIQ